MPKKGAAATPNINSKKELGQARKAEQKAQKDAQDAAAQAAAEAATWTVGAKKPNAKAEAAAAKADELARKKREKEELLAAEEAVAGGGTTKAAKKAVIAAAQQKKKKKGGKNDLALLEDALQSSADKAAKKKRELAARKQKAIAEEQASKSAAATTAAAQQQVDPLLANTDALLDGAAGRELNKASMEAAGTSGIDAALDALNLKKGSTPAKAKALYSAFEARMLPIVKEENPGLRLSQYKERVFLLWKKSPENPANMQATTSK